MHMMGMATSFTFSNFKSVKLNAMNGSASDEDLHGGYGRKTKCEKS